MSEGSFLDYASQPGTDEILHAVGQKAQTLMSLGTEVITSWSNKAAESARARQAEAEAAERGSQERLRASKKAEMPLMQRVWNERWWDRPPTPEQIGQTWETVAGWAANGDEYARITLGQLTTEIKQRFELTDEQVQALDAAGEVPLKGSEVARILATGRGPMTEKDIAEEKAEFNAAPERTYSYVIRDLESDEVVAAGTEPWPHRDGRPVELVAAQKMREFIVGRVQDESAEPAAQGRYVIDIAEGEQVSDEGFRLEDQQTETVREAYDQWSADVRSGTLDATPEQRRDALLVERDRLRGALEDLEPDHRTEKARDYLSAEIEGRGRVGEKAPDREPRRDAGMPAAQRAELVADLREQIARTELELEVADAEVRGEDPDLIVQAAQLRECLDQDWWNSASPEEIAGMWAHVDGWQEGEAKHGLRRELQAEIHRHHHVDIAQGASFAKVSSEVHRAQAEAEGRRVLRFEITGLGRDGGRIIQGQGRTTPDKSEPLDQVGRRQLAAFAGGMDAAREQDLRIRFADAAGFQVAELDAEGDYVRDSPEQREADRRRDRSRDTETKAERTEETAADLGRRPDWAFGQEATELHEQAADQRADAERDLAAAERLEEIKRAEPQGVTAMQAAGKGTPLTVRQQLAMFAKRKAALGPKRGPRSNRSLGRHRGEPER